MRVVLFCGGLGMRMRPAAGTLDRRRRSSDCPKPMVALGGQPLLWHLMSWYSHWGHREFVLCLGYGGDVIESWVRSHRGVELRPRADQPTARRFRITEGHEAGWDITLVDTGADASVGQRLRAVQPFVADQDVFMANYADGLSDVALPDLIALSEAEGAVATFMAAPLKTSMHAVTLLPGAPTVGHIGPLAEQELLINAGFFVLRTEIFDYLRPGEELVVEPFQRLIAEGRLAALDHRGFFLALDTTKDVVEAEVLWQNNERPWAHWEEVDIPLPTPPTERQQLAWVPAGSVAPAFQSAADRHADAAP